MSTERASSRDDIAQQPAPETDATRHGDKIRNGEAGSPSYLYKLAVNKDDYNHAMIHAGYVVPKDAPSFLACPLCGASFARAALGGEGEGT